MELRHQDFLAATFNWCIIEECSLFLCPTIWATEWMPFDMRGVRFDITYSVFRYHAPRDSPQYVFEPISNMTSSLFRDQEPQRYEFNSKVAVSGMTKRFKYNSFPVLKRSTAAFNYLFVIERGHISTRLQLEPCRNRKHYCASPRQLLECHTLSLKSCCVHQFASFLKMKI